MAKQTAMMQLREEAVSGILERLSLLSKGFTKPKLILIGGYALRAFVDISRYTRDCDFAVRERHLEQIKGWLELSAEAFHQERDYGFLRLLKLLKTNGSPVKLSFDFMQGEIRGRTEEDKVVIDRNFVQNSKRVLIKIWKKNLDVFVPEYADYLILKIASARPSDIRDIAALLWKNDIPEMLMSRASEIVSNQEVFAGNIKEIIKSISDKRFVDSWRGTFLTREFTEKDKERVIAQLEGVVQDFI